MSHTRAFDSLFHGLRHIEVHGLACRLPVVLFEEGVFEILYAAGALNFGDWLMKRIGLP